MFKHPYWCRRIRTSTPDLFTPYLLGPELILPSPMSVVQTVPVYSISRSCSNLSNASPFYNWKFLICGLCSIIWFGSGPPEALVLYTLTLVSLKIFWLGLQHALFFSSWMDWWWPPGPSTSYTAPIPSGPTVPTSRDPLPSIQRFYQDFRLPNYPLDTFSGRLFDVVSSTTFLTGDTQTELNHAITRLIYVVVVLF